MTICQSIHEHTIRTRTRDLRNETKTNGSVRNEAKGKDKNNLSYERPRPTCPSPYSRMPQGIHVLNFIENISDPGPPNSGSIPPARNQGQGPPGAASRRSEAPRSKRRQEAPAAASSRQQPPAATRKQQEPSGAAHQC